MNKINLLNNFPVLKDVIWGNSIALAWTWGFGLFFSIQFALMFGSHGLLWFASSNAFGLALFGVGVHYLVKKLSAKNINFYEYFVEKTQKYLLMFIVFQVIAVSINVFGFVRYVAIPLGYSLIASLCLLFIIPVLIASRGRTANIKWIHLILAIPFIISIFTILFTLNFSNGGLSAISGASGLANVPMIYYLGWGVAVTLAFLFGPWLDIQHWQRAMQIQEEKANLTRSYIIGGILFFLIMIFHGFLALYVLEHGVHFIGEPILGDFVDYRNTAITTLANYSKIGIFYLVFLFVASLSSITSCFESYRWYFQEVREDKQLLHIYLLYLLGFISAGVLAWNAFPAEIYEVFLSFFIVYQYCIVFGLFDISNRYPVDLNGIASILGLLIALAAFGLLAIFSTTSGLILLGLPPLALVILALYIYKRRLT